MKYILAEALNAMRRLGGVHAGCLRGRDRRYDLDRLGLDALPPPWEPHRTRALANTGMPIREALRAADGRFSRVDGDYLTDVYHTAHRTTPAKVTTPAQRDALVAELQRRVGVDGGWWQLWTGQQWDNLTAPAQPKPQQATP